MNSIVNLIGSRCEVTYTNYKSETATRRIRIEGLFYGCTQYHSSFQLLLSVYDLDKQVDRMFALCDISDWKILAE